MTEYKQEYLEFLNKTIPQLKTKLTNTQENAKTTTGYYIINIRQKLIDTIQVEGTDDDDEYEKALKIYGIKKLDKMFDKLILLEETYKFDKAQKLKPKIIKELEKVEAKIRKIKGE